MKGRKPNSQRSGRSGYSKNSDRRNQQKKDLYGSKPSENADEYGKSKQGKKMSRSADELNPFNDFSWYNANPSLTVGAANVPFPYKSGMTIPIFDRSTDLPDYFIPGVVSINWAPFVGVGGHSTDPINIAAREIFNQVRESFSGSIEADSPDFIMYFMALDSIFSYIGMMKRIYRICATYSPENYNIPNALMHAMGFPAQRSGEAIRKNRVKLWQYINELVNMTRKFRCPDVFPVFRRHYWLNDNVYMDAPEANSQMYIFNMKYVLKFSMIEDPDTKVSSGGLLYEPVSITGQLDELVDVMYQQCLGLIQALSNADDTFIISGYLSRAFGDSGSFYLDELPQMDVFTPLYEPEVLMQIENAYTPFGPNSVYPQITLTSITQDPGANIVTTNFAVASPSGYQNDGVVPYINARVSNPGVVDVVEASRLQTYFVFSESDTKMSLIAGTEINLGYRIFNVGVEDTAGYPFIQWASGTDANNIANLAFTMGALAPFDWHPFVFTAYTINGAVWPVIAGDIHNLTVLSYSQMREINKVCLYSEFNAFGIGR